MCCFHILLFFFSSKRRHTRCALVTGVQTCALPISTASRLRPEAVVAPSSPHDLNLDRAERRLVEEALKKHGYNISLAAAELGLSRGALYRRMEKHGL